MKKVRLLVLPVLMLCVLFFFAVSAFGSGCDGLLGDNVYRCQVKSDFGDPFEDCLRFNSSAPTVSDMFDLSVDGLNPGAPLGCSCKSTGSFTSPKFNGSKEWVCVTPMTSADGVGYVWGGKVASKGKINHVYANGSMGDSFIFNCVIDPACIASPSLVDKVSSGTGITYGQ
jgi:hypothetical protein